MTATKNCILLVSDQEYLKYFYPLIYSIKRNVDMDDVAVRMHFINVTAEHADFIVDNFPNASITFETKSLSEEKIKPTRFKEMPKLLGNFISEKHAYCNNKRYEILDLLLSTNYKNVLYMDVDHLVRGDLNPLFQLIANHDIIVHKYPLDKHPIAWKRFMTYCCGMIGIHNTPISKKFIHSLSKEVAKNGILEWGDQLDFRTVLSGMRKDIDLGQIPQQFKDDEFSDDSKIWTGDGNKKFHEKFIKESNL